MRRSVLVADDEALIRMGLAEMLRSQGYDIAGEAADGERAVELTREARPDVVLLDVKMPRLDGIAAARRIMETAPTAIVLLTAYGDADLVEQAASAGVLGYLVKPIKDADLRPALETALARFREMQSLRDEIGDLRATLEARKVIERAKGIVMRRHGVDEAEAFARIQRRARDSRKTMREIAEAIITAEET